MSFNHTEEAEALFTRFSERYGLHYIVEDTNVSRMDIDWTFPVQEGLSLPITLGLQDYDTLNLGISDFWSYFFPFKSVAEDFEGFLDAWVTGRARIAKTGRWGRVFQVLEGGEWATIYRADTSLWPFGRKPYDFLCNQMNALSPD